MDISKIGQMNKPDRNDTQAVIENKFEKRRPG